jgi:hypothetical protein
LVIACASSFVACGDTSPADGAKNLGGAAGALAPETSIRSDDAKMERNVETAPQEGAEKPKPKPKPTHEPIRIIKHVDKSAPAPDDQGVRPNAAAD